MKKTIKYILVAVLTVITYISQAQEKKELSAKFQVEGVCNMCKARIENAALISGVKYVEWDQSSSLLSVIYKPGKVTELEIHQAIAEEGHDTSEVEADSISYRKLPDCCAYRDDHVQKH